MSKYVIRNNDLPGDTVSINAEPGMKLPNGKETSGEFVVNSNATAAFGPMLEYMNNMVPRHYSKNNFALGQEGKAHESINMLMVKSTLANMLPPENVPQKIEANEFASLPISDSPVRQRVDATRNMQNGGEVKTIRGSRPVELNFDDPSLARTIMSVPASEVGGEGGDRYYLGEGRMGALPELAIDRASFDARQKMAFSPADSIPQAMVEGYFDKPSKVSGFLKRLGINKQEGGQVGKYEKALQRAEMMGDAGYALPESLSAPAEEMSNMRSAEDLYGIYMRMGPEMAKHKMSGMESRALDSLLLQKMNNMGNSAVPHYQGGGQVSSGNMPTVQVDQSNFRTPIIRESDIKNRRQSPDYSPENESVPEKLQNLPSDSYGGKEVPKNAMTIIPYLKSFGRMRTPIGERDRFMYQRLGLNPDALPPQMQGLIGKALLQQIGAEGI